MREPHINDTIIIIQSRGVFAKDQLYRIKHVDDQNILFDKVDEKYPQGAYWAPRHEQDVVWALWDNRAEIALDIIDKTTGASVASLPVTAQEGLDLLKKISPTGFIGSQNLPIDLDWDEYER